MTNLTRIEAVRQSLATAINTSKDAADGDSAEAEAVEADIFEAELTLRQREVGRPDLATRLETVLMGDVTTADARTELRQVAQKLDAELAPDVSTASFVPASDGGVRE